MYRRILRKVELPAQPNIVDIGANVGGFSLMLLVDGVHISKLLCVEMNPNTYNRLSFNINSNFRDVAAVVNAAVVGTSRPLLLNLGIGSTGDSIYHGSCGNDLTDKHSVQGLSFDDLFDKYVESNTVDLCKIDIEGAEVELFNKSAANQSLSRCRYIVVEMHPIEHYDSMVQYLASRGFSLETELDNRKCGVKLFRNLAF